MEKGKGRGRRLASFGVFAAALMLALCVPAMAFAATATFSSKTPASGARTAALRPTISVIVVDRFGVTGTSNYSITLDGVRRTTALSRFAGTGLTKFKLSFVPGSNLALGTHTVSVRVKDREAHVSTVSWSFTVVDTAPPVTTSDAVLNYVGLAVITLHATDNFSVAHTYYMLDGGPQTTYVGAISVPAAGALNPLHTIEFWSVDGSGNVEAHHLVPFFVTQTFAMNHSLPTLAADAICMSSGCHGTDPRNGNATDLATIHLFAYPGGTIPAAGCAACHAGTATPSSDCTHCHGVNGPHGTTHIAITSSGVGVANCQQANCHDQDVINATMTNTVHTSCAQCHSSTDPIVVAAIAAGIAPSPVHARCETCHPDGFATIHAPGDAAHVVAAGDVGTCGTGNGVSCHSGTAPVIHSTVASGGPDPAPGCRACHVIGHTPATVSCTQPGFGCHTAGLNVHPAVAGGAHTTTNSCAAGNAANCHHDNIVVIHSTQLPGGTIAPPGCVACHGAGQTPSSNCQDADCHPTSPHVGVTLHTATASASCVMAGCHDSNVMVVHNVWVLHPIGCVACHSSTATPGTTCSVCHPNEHANQPTDHASQMNAACTGLACHAVDSGVVSPTHVADLGTEHQNWGITCLDCHASLDTRVLNAIDQHQNACTVCHNGDSGGTHANANLNANYHGFEFLNPGNASGHNVLGSPVGMKSKFDGSQGVTLLDTNGNAVVTTWGIPTTDVFWAAGDPQAPGTAITGLNSNSVITCNNCHDAAAGIQATGPHGSTQTWATDPNYPAPFDMAVNSHTTASGIKLRTSVSVSATSGSLVDGGQPGANGVICAKCHDLQNPGTGTWNSRAVPPAASGSGNTAHASHHFDTVDGSADCISCHVAIPHGWKRPRLLLDSSVDQAPYKSPSIRGRIVGGAFVHVGLGPISAGDDHSLITTGSLLTPSFAPWTESKCIACGDEHEGEGNLSAAASDVVTGTAVTYYATTGPNMGKVEFEIDESPDESTALFEQVYDLYSPTVQYQVPIAVVTGMVNTTHTVEVEWLGTKNPASTDTFINIDKLLLNKGTVEQSTGWTFDGIWTTVPDVLASGGSYTMSNDPGNDNAKLR